MEQKISQKTLNEINEIFTEEISNTHKQSSDINGTRIIDAEYFCTDGSINSAPMSISFLRDENGKAIGILGMGVDEAETKDVFEHLRESNIDYRRLFESAQDGMLILDAQTGKIKDVNPYLIKMLGCRKKDIRAKMIWEIGAFRNIAATKEQFLDLKNNGYMHYENMPLVTKDGEQIEVEFVCNEYTADNRKIMQCNIRDISERIRMQNKIKHEQNLAKLYFDTANVMFIVIGRDEIIISANKRSSEILATDINDIVGKNWFDVFLSPSERDEARKLFNKMIGGKLNTLRFYENHIIIAKGQKRLISWHNSVLRDNGNIIGVICSGNDITEHREAEAALAQSEHKHRSYIENAPNGIFVFDEAGNFLEANKAASEITGYSIDDLLHMKMSDILSKETLSKIEPSFIKFVEAGGWSASLQYKHNGGSTKWLTVDTVKLSENRYLGFAKDITEIKRFESELLHLGYHDALTGVYNRRFFEEELRRLDTERNLPISIIMGDVNGLKIINDSFGHSTGDMVLRKTADIIKKSCRSDEIVARLGGDEFVIILPKTSHDKAELVVERIKSLFSKEKIAGIELSVSFGIDTKEYNDQKLSEVFVNAENHMYRQKIFEHASMRNETIDMIMQALFEKSSRESQHSKRVSEISGTIALKLGINADKAKQIRLAGLVHDIGKISINETILNKAMALDEQELAEIKKHPEAGWRILSSVKEFFELAQFILEHHEWWDGSGYPKGLKGNQISIEARIISICDAYDAMTNKGSYKKELSKDDALKEIKNCAGTQFDPYIVESFISQISTITAD